MPISGVKVTRPTKADLVGDIASVLSIRAPAVSAGGSVDSEFLDAIHVALTGVPTGGSDAYRKAELVLDRLGLTYDPYWDTSESSPTGGSTVTARAYSRIRSAITRTPRCFILNVTDAPVGNRWERDHEKVYRYDDTVTGRRPLNDAGPGSRVLYYATSNSSTDPKHFIATATVAYIDPGWTGPWEARLEDYMPLPDPVSVDELDLPGWNRQHAITEIAPETFDAIVQAGRGGRLAGAGEVDGADRGGGDVAERVLQDFPAMAAPTIEVPPDLPASVPPSVAAVVPSYTDNDGRIVSSDPDLAAPRSHDQRRNRLAERRAIELATRALEADGWVRTADRQKDGVGYDLEFQRANRTLKVEVKGIQGAHLDFNITPKELWRAETDPEWVVVAVTSVLSPSAFAVHLVTRDRIVSARRVITGYRLGVDR